MTRKEWLQAFLRLADSGASAVNYRKELRIMNKELAGHVKKLGKYRKELADILEQERLAEKQRREKLKAAERKQAKSVERRIKAQKASSDLRGTVKGQDKDLNDEKNDDCKV